VGMGAIGNGEVALTGATSELHRQAVSTKFSRICGFSIEVRSLAEGTADTEEAYGRLIRQSQLGRSLGSRCQPLTRDYVTSVHGVFIFNEAEPVHQLDVLDLARGILEMILDVLLSDYGPWPVSQHSSREAPSSEQAANGNSVPKALRSAPILRGDMRLSG